MNSLLLGLALSSSPATAAQPPLPPALPRGTPITGPGPYQYGYPTRPAYYQPPTPTPPIAPPFAPGEPPPGFPVPQGPMTLAQFGHCFKPTPGHHTVCLIHPVTCRPVTVCFDLPYGCACPKVKVRRKSIEFDYGRREVEIQFRHNGSYKVDYD